MNFCLEAGEEKLLKGKNCFPDEKTFEAMKRAEDETGRRVVLEEVIYECDQTESIKNLQLVYSHGFKSEIIGKQESGYERYTITLRDGDPIKKIAIEYHMPLRFSRMKSIKFLDETSLRDQTQVPNNMKKNGGPASAPRTQNESDDEGTETYMNDVLFGNEVIGIRYNLPDEKWWEMEKRETRGGKTSR